MLAKMALPLLLAANVQAETIYVIGDMIDDDTETIDAKTINALPTDNIATVLNQITGFNIKNNSNKSFTVRGNSKNVEVYVDGILINDPTQIDDNANLNELQLNQINKIQVKKGMTTVINIETKKQNAIGVTQYLNEEKLSSGRINLNVGNYYLNSSYTSSKGVDLSNSGGEKDEMRHFDINLGSKFDLWKGASLKVHGAAVKRTDDMDKWDNKIVDQENFEGEYKRKSLGATLTSEYLDGAGEVEINVQRSNFERSYIDTYSSEYKGSVTRYQVKNTNYIAENLSNKFAITHDAEADKMIRDRVDRTKFDNELNYKFATLGLHYDYGEYTSYDLKLSKDFDDLSVYALGGTFFNRPSLYQLHAPYGGNDNLDNEHGYEFEIGAKYKFINAAVFYRSEKNKIGYDMTASKYFNREDDHLYGAELQLMHEYKDLEGRIGYTYTNSDREYLPEHLLNLTTIYKLNDAWQFSGNFYARNHFMDFGNARASGYGSFDLGVTHIYKKQFTLNAFVQNVLGNEYTDAVGYHPKDRTFVVTFEYAI